VSLHSVVAGVIVLAFLYTALVLGLILSGREALARAASVRAIQRSATTSIQASGPSTGATMSVMAGARRDQCCSASSPSIVCDADGAAEALGVGATVGTAFGAVPASTMSVPFMPLS
jgi:hypothetical protein